MRPTIPVFEDRGILVKAKISIEQPGTALDKQRIVNKRLGSPDHDVADHSGRAALLAQPEKHREDRLETFAVDTGLILQIGKEFCLTRRSCLIEIQEIAGGHVLRFAFFFGQ